VQSNGDVPLLPSEYLRAGARRNFSDAQEFELFSRDGTRLVETDLLALVDRQLLMAEAKSNNTLGTRRERLTAARKRARVAKLLLADDVVLGTTTEAWEEASVTAMRQALLEESWPTGSPPGLRTITNLGSSAVSDKIESV
jgi:hypothetical protein